MNNRGLVVAVAGALVVAGAGGAWAVTRVGHGDPDPGGRILAVAQTVGQALPPGARVLLQQAVEPRWDSCDGRPETEGWSNVFVDVEFDSTGDPQDVVRDADKALTASGWHRTQILQTSLGPGAVWSQSVGGTAVTASLSQGVTGSGLHWELAAVAPPNGQRVSGC